MSEHIGWSCTSLEWRPCCSARSSLPSCCIIRLILQVPESRAVTVIKIHVYHLIVFMSGYQNAGNTKTPYKCGPTGWVLLLYITMTIILVAFLVWMTHQEDFLDGSSPRTALLFVGECQHVQCQSVDSNCCACRFGQLSGRGDYVRQLQRSDAGVG